MGQSLYLLGLVRSSRLELVFHHRSMEVKISIYVDLQEIVWRSNSNMVLCRNRHSHAYLLRARQIFNRERGALARLLVATSSSQSAT
jgi:hypothetical protein